MTRRKRTKAAARGPADDRPPASAANRAQAGSKWIVVLVLAIPVLLVLIYAQLTHRFSPNRLLGVSLATGPSVGPAAARPGGPLQAQPGGLQGQMQGQARGQTQGPDQADFAQLAARLAQRLESAPNDPVGWNTLAHTYYVLQRFDEAVAAYERLLQIGKPSASTLADYADALAMAQGRSLEGRPMELVQQALALDPAQWKALSMAATDAFQRKDYATAIGYWQRALATTEPGSELAASIEANLAEARQLSATK